MPYVTIYTNVNSENGKDVAEEVSSLTAKILSKPESYVITNVVYNPNMSFGGSADNKGALIELKSIGLGDKDRFVAEITTLMANKLQISNKQYIAISLMDIPAAFTACAGHTFG